MTNKIEITRESYRNALIEAVQLKGADYVYPRHSVAEAESLALTCRYVEEDGQPGCIHGHALTYLGYQGLPEGKGIWDILKELNVSDYYLRSAAEESQIAQDSGETWGQALEEFDLVLGHE